MAKSPLKYSLTLSEQKNPEEQESIQSTPSSASQSMEGVVVDAGTFLAGIQKTDVEIAQAIIHYFQVPESGVAEQTRFNRDGSSYVEKVSFFTPIPLFSEIAHVIGLTEHELMELGKQHPATIGRAIEFGRDTIKTFGFRRGLTGFYDAQTTKLLLTNETNVKDKSERNVKFLDGNKLLDQIEAAKQPLIYDDEQGF